MNIGNDIVDLSAPRAKSKHLDARFIKRVFSNAEQLSIKKSSNPSIVLWAIWAAKEAAFKACQQSDNNLTLVFNKFTVTNDSLVKLESIPKKLSFTNKEFTQNNLEILKLIPNKNKFTYTEIIGTLEYKNLTLSIKWQFFKNYIHCLAVLTKATNNNFKNWEQINYNIFKIIPKNLSLNSKKITKITACFTPQELDSIFSYESLQTRYYAKQFIADCNNKSNVEIIRPAIVINNQNRLGPPIVLTKHNNINNVNITNSYITLTHDGRFGAVAIQQFNQ